MQYLKQNNHDFYKTTHCGVIVEAISVVTNTWAQRIRFYTDGLGYQILEEGQLSLAQKNVFGSHLGRYVLRGHQEGSVVRLLETTDAAATPKRVHRTTPASPPKRWFFAGPLAIFWNY